MFTGIALIIGNPVIRSYPASDETRRLVGDPISRTFSSVNEISPQECDIETTPFFISGSLSITPTTDDLGEVICKRSPSVAPNSIKSSGFT